ncbi:MAG: DUF308 domain-containing protein [Bacteroidales bacterium]|nr:DUF308 domain-containing protein [Bacteroidales bacterium]MDD4671906.1 DUF308 domain-containing protein [Bacteroidales bacterium]MDY0348684.1 DUF308 domain-containing protein [Tenuifilaceae bacterium]
MKLNRFGKWSLSSLNGMLLVIFGLVTILMPELAIAVLAIYFAITIMLGGLILSIFTLKHKVSLPNWKARLTEGVLSLVLGLVILIKPQSAAAFLVYVMGLWAFFIGVVFIVSYFRRKAPDLVGAFNLIAGGVSVVLGLIIVFNPFESTRFLVVLIGIYALAFGIFTMVYSSRVLKSEENDIISDVEEIDSDAEEVDSDAE